MITTEKIAFRRIAAFMIDWMVLAVYAAGLFLFISPVVAPLFTDSPFMAELTGFGLITLPMVLYFSIAEASPGQATIGKRVLRLKVSQRRSTRRLTYLQAFQRAAIKFLPWELAHFAIWNAFVFTGNQLYSVGIAALIVSYALIFVYVGSLFVGKGRTPYDRISSTVVSDR